MCSSEGCQEGFLSCEELKRGKEEENQRRESELRFVRTSKGRTVIRRVKRPYLRFSCAIVLRASGSGEGVERFGKGECAGE